MTDVLVLCLHAVSPRWPADLSITPERLERLLTGLVRRGYRGATFRDAVSAPTAPRTVAVTFDDAYRSVIELAFPILKQLGLPGTVFVPTDWAGAEKPMVWPGIDHWVGGRTSRSSLRCHGANSIVSPLRDGRSARIRVRTRG
jgi:peptidoglycan/xylan/chitin deacetylase (PgdA/CDA1 family)